MCIRDRDYTKYQGVYSSEWYWAKILRTSRLSEKIREAAFSWVEHCDWITGELAGNTDPLTMYRCSCAAGHKALWHSEWNGLPDAECLGSLDPALKKNALNFGRNVRPAGTKVGTPVSYTHLIVLPERIYKTDCCVVEYAKENHIKIEL